MQILVGRQLHDTVSVLYDFSGNLCASIHVDNTS